MMKINRIPIIVCLLLSFGVNAQDLDTYFLKVDDFFKSYVKDGRINYLAIKKDEKSLATLLKMAKNIEVSVHNPNYYQAFWINGYNLLVIKSIVNHYPISSPLDKPGFFDEDKHEIGQKWVTLNEIEHQLLLEKFNYDPRFHFVLVCAGLGCPPIINQAYKPHVLDEQLTRQTQLTINHPDFVSVNKNKAKVSQIFEWYNDDFTSNGKSLIDFINQYRNLKLPQKTKILFHQYNWSLNEFHEKTSN